MWEDCKKFRCLIVCLFVFYGISNIFTDPSARPGYDTRSIFKRSLTGLNSEFSFSLTSCLTKAEEPSLSYYLPIAGGRIIGFIPFPRVLVLCEMQSVSSRTWTRVAVSISYDVLPRPFPPPQIDRTLSVATIPGQSEPGRDGNKEVPPFSKAPAFLESHHQIVEFYYLDTLCDGGGGLPLCRDAVGVFYSP